MQDKHADLVADAGPLIAIGYVGLLYVGAYFIWTLLF